MVDALWLTLAATAWLATAYKLREQARPGNRTPAGMTLVFGCTTMALAITVKLSPVVAAIDHVTGRPLTAQHLAHLFIMGAAFCGQVFLVYTSFPAAAAHRQVRRLTPPLIATVITLGTVFALTTRAPRPSLVEFNVLYMSVYTAYFGLSCAIVGHLAWRHAHWTDQDFARISMRIISFGCGAAVLYSVVRLALSVLRALGATGTEPIESALVLPLIAAGALLASVGITLPGWGPRVAALQPLVRRLGRRRAHRLLYPLWSDLVRWVPEVALEPPRSALHDVVAARDLDRRLHRRVIEIEDGLLRLRPYRDPAAGRLARAAAEPELEADALAAVVEAAVVAAALRSATGRERRPATAAQPAGGLHKTDPDGEVRWLCLVALAYRYSPIVPTVLAGLDAAEADPRRAEEYQT